MKILYAVQATGNGHISRAREIIPHFMNHGEVDVLASGRQAEVNLPYLIKYKKKGLSYTFGQNGGIDIIDSIKNLHPFDLYKDMRQFPVEDYDLVVNDFEPVTAWACKFKKKPCVAMSHQAAYLSDKTPRPKQIDKFGEWVFRNYAPATDLYGFHFRQFDKFVYTPVIRSEVRKLEIRNRNHITVYLPAHSDEIMLREFEKHKDVKWEIFSKHSKTSYVKGHISVAPVNNEKFLTSMADSDGVITAGGFESVAEAIHLRKKVIVVPMIGQYEQQCNAIAAKDIGVTLVKTIDGTFESKVSTWLKYGMPPDIYYPDQTASIVENIIKKHNK